MAFEAVSWMANSYIVITIYLFGLIMTGVYFGSAMIGLTSALILFIYLGVESGATGIFHIAYLFILMIIMIASFKIINTLF